MNCEYCNTTFKTKSALNNHKIKAKYCLILQGKIEPSKEEIFKCNLCNKILSSKQYLELHKDKCEGKKHKIDVFKCKHCDKILSTKQMLENHNNICSIKKEKDQTEYKEKLEKEIKEYKNQLEKQDKEYKNQLEKQDKEYKNQLEKQKNELKEEYKNQLEKQEDQIKDLQDKLEKLAIKAIDRPTIVSNTTNNNLNIDSSMNFNDIEQIKDIIENNLNINHIVDGQKGLANFVKEIMLIDDNGKLKYICTDPSRSIFKYKDTNGEIKKDVEAKKLTDYILKGGIKKRSAIIGNEWVQNETNNKLYLDKLEIMMEFQENIHKLAENNTNFKRELAALTS